MNSKRHSARIRVHSGSVDIRVSRVEPKLTACKA